MFNVSQIKRMGWTQLFWEMWPKSNNFTMSFHSPGKILSKPTYKHQKRLNVTIKSVEQLKFTVYGLASIDLKF